jgi:hypothetical protein
VAKQIVINEEDFPSNSKAPRVAPIRETRRIREEGANIEEKPALRRSIAGRAVRVKKTFTQSVAESLVGDTSKNVGLYIMNDVLIPAAKNLIQEMVTSGIEMMLFGETSGRSRNRDRDRGKSTISYGSFYKDRDDRRERKQAIVRGDKFDLDEIYFRNGDEADQVLRDLCDLLEQYEQVTVSDYFDLAGIEGATWAHTKYGWEDLRRARCTHTRHGYAIILPDPIELD